MRKYIKFNEVLITIIIILLVVLASLATFILTKETSNPPEILTEVIKSVETINITKIITEEIEKPDCIYARTPGHIKQCYDKYK